MKPRPPLAGALSCLIFVASTAVFLFMAWKVGVLPLTRGGWQTVGTYTHFQEFWTRVFFTSTLLGAGVGGAGLRRRTELRGVVIAGLSLNLAALAALVLYTTVPG